VVVDGVAAELEALRPQPQQQLSYDVAHCPGRRVRGSPQLAPAWVSIGSNCEVMSNIKKLARNI
jgi:hypothetical protein